MCRLLCSYVPRHVHQLSFVVSYYHNKKVSHLLIARNVLGGISLVLGAQACLSDKLAPRVKMNKLCLRLHHSP